MDEFRMLKLPFGQYAVIGGRVLEAHGIRKGNDVDIVVLPELYNHLRSQGWKRKWLFTGVLQCKAIQNGDFEAYSNMHRGSFNPRIEDVIARADVVGGIPYINLDDLIGLKRGIGREKDLGDIVLIEEHRKSGGCPICAKK